MSLDRFFVFAFLTTILPTDSKGLKSSNSRGPRPIKVRILSLAGESLRSPTNNKFLQDFSLSIYPLVIAILVPVLEACQPDLPRRSPS